jgi:3-hydroxypropionyl-CoA synthetase (ADP-forming)
VSSLALSDYGFIRPRSALAGSEDEAAILASDIGYPVALKIESPDILHKTDLGGVELGLDSEKAVRAAYRRMRSVVEVRAPQARIEGVRVEEMLSGGFEIIIGLKRDAQFGPVIMFGLGGIFTELLDDVSFRVLPITPEDARQMVTEIRGARVLQGFRGQAPISPDLLVDLLLRAARFGLDLGDRLESVDLNPVLVWGHEHRVLDAKVVTNAPTEAGRAGVDDVRRPDTAYLDTFFKAQSVAVVGASATAGKIGHAVLESLAKHEYRGEVFPVNPGKKSILGLEAYPTLSDIPRPLELVIGTVDLAFVPDLLRECASRDVHNLVVVSGGGKELGGDRVTLEAEIRRIARDLGVRVIGPNCIGVFDGTTRLDTFFQPHERMTRPPAGPVAMMSQSGTVGIAFLEDMVSTGISRFVSYGNRVDVDEADLLSYLADDPGTSVIAIYVEGFENGRVFLETAQRTAAQKPVVIFKAGRTASAAQAALTHTGFFAGSYKVAEGAFRQAGLIAVDTYEELVAVSKALALQPRASGGRVAMIGNGVGTIVQALDILGDAGLLLATLAPHTIEHLTDVYPSFYIVQNPLDVTGSGTSSDYETGIQALLDDPGVDIVMPWFVFQDVPLGEDIPEVMGRLNRTATKPILAAATGGAFTRRLSGEIESQGVPVFHSVRDWVAAARGIAFRSDRGSGAA